MHEAFVQTITEGLKNEKSIDMRTMHGYGICTVLSVTGNTEKGQS